MAEAIPESHKGQEPSGPVGQPTDVTETSHPALFEAVGKSLSTLEEPEGTIKEEPQATEEPEAPAQPEATSDEATEAAAPESTDPKASTLPDAIRRSLKAYQWTDEEIDSALTQNPDGFLATATKIHSTRNDEVARWADMGRRARETQAAEPPPVVQQPVVQQPPAPAPSLEEQIFQAEQTASQPDPALQQQMAEVQSLRKQLQGELKMAQDLRTEVYGREMDQFFSGSELSKFGALYGPDFRSASGEQFDNRNKVMTLANDLLDGSNRANRPLQLEDALQIAHESVSKDFQETVIRQNIKEQVTERSKSLSMEPSPSKAAPESDNPKTEEELEAKVARGWREMWG